MPTLNQRIDGCYYVRHFYRDHSTWQVDADGVRYLRDRRIRTGDWFATDVFMEMWARSLVYTGSRPRISQPDSGTSSDPELEASVEATFKALYRRDYPNVYKTLASATIAVNRLMTVEDFASKVAGASERRLISWKVRVIESAELRDDNWPGDDRTGFVLADFEIEDSSGQREKYLSRQEIWLRTNGVWYWLWRDWHE
jgi:hypothetical protein